MALTKYPSGSLRELWAIALPLMICSFSCMFMLFVDRLFLANYSTEALNATVQAATFGWVFTFSGFILTNISEVFVAQNNGAQNYKKIGKPVWQMIWLSIFSIALFIPLGYWGTDLFYGSAPEIQMEKDYFRIMIYFGPSFCFFGALSGFFIGRGKTFAITLIAIGANILNAILDIILIFGVEGWVESMGIIGASLATSASVIFQVIILGYLFLKKSNREQFGTADYAFDPEAFWSCFKVGFPSAMFVAVEVAGWAAFYYLMMQAGDHYITIAGICQSVALLFYFLGEGVGKAATTLAGNMIGAKQHDTIQKVLKSGVRLHFLFYIILLGIFAIASDFTIEKFLPFAAPEEIEALYGPLIVCLFCILTYVFFESVRLLLAGLLTAAGDTIFLLIAGACSVWALLVVPIYFIIVLNQGPMEVASAICVFYSMVACVIYLWRFRQGRWKSIAIIS